MGSKSLIGMVVTAAIVFGACSTAAAKPPARAINATTTEFKIAVDTATVAAGDVTFTVTNSGTVAHEFVVVKTDIASAALPTDDAGKIAEGGSLSAVDELEDIDPATSKTMTLKLDAGKYVFFCNLPGHFAGGMRGDFVVAGS